jgi:hypothetical protein
MVSKEFVEELRAQFERYVQLKDRLDTKANNIIMMSATVATFFAGLGGFLLEHIDHKTYPNHVLIDSILLILQISLTCITIICAFMSYRIRTYVHPISYEAFYKRDGSTNDEVIKQFENSTDDEINDHFVMEYIKSIRSYEEQNNSQSGWVDHARWTFIASIGIIPFFLYILLLTKFS